MDSAWGRIPDMDARTPAKRRADVLPSAADGALLETLKKQGAAAAGELARELRMSREAARQRLARLERHGWVARKRAPQGGRGRPRLRFALTPAGEQLFPKQYAMLSLTLVDTVAQQFGEPALTRLLAALTDQQVQQWEKKLAGKSLPERVRALKGIYFEGDPYTAVRKDRSGYRLFERNCPYLSLALHRPRLCSVTVSTLMRLLGVRVVREKRFQTGDGQCIFRILADQPIDTTAFRFAYEDEAASR